MQFEKTATLSQCDEQSSSDHNVAIVERDITFIDFKDMSEDQQSIVATWLHERTEKVTNMLTVAADDVAQKHLGIVALRHLKDEEWEIAGYVGAMESGEHDGKQMSEVGSLYVEAPYRKREVLVGTTTLEGKQDRELMRISKALCYYATVALEAEGIQPYAFCNEGSCSIFEALDYEERGLGDVPQAAGVLCKTSCDFYDKCHPDKCCDKIMVKQAALAA